LPCYRIKIKSSLKKHRLPSESNHPSLQMHNICSKYKPKKS
jgi:hypothetical protein